MKRLPLLLAVLALVVAGCGSSSDKTSPSTSATTPAATTPAAGGGHDLALSADPNELKYDKSTLAASSGKVTITMKNPAGLSHDVAIKGNGVNKVGPTVGQGGTSTVTANLKPGTYVYYCSVDGHESAGMRGTLTVR